MAIGDTLTVGDVREKIDYKIVEDDDFTLVTVSAPRVETEPETDAEADAEGTEEASTEE